LNLPDIVPDNILYGGLLVMAILKKYFSIQFRKVLAHIVMAIILSSENRTDACGKIFPVP
jgi:hypothetical protein